MGKWGAAVSYHTKSEATPQVDMGITDLILTATAAGDTVTFVEGQDASSGRTLLKWYAPGAGSYPIAFSRPMYAENGVYMTFSTNIINVSVVYTPYFDDPPMYNEYGKPVQ